MMQSKNDDAWRKFELVVTQNFICFLLPILTISFRAGLRGGGGGAITPGPSEKGGPPISDKKFVYGVLKKKDFFGFKFNQIKYEKFRRPLNHFCML